MRGISIPDTTDILHCRKIVTTARLWYSMDMHKAVVHDRREETPEAKAAWFQSLTLEERMELLCEFTDLILENNPHIAEGKHAQPVEGHVLVLNR